MGFIQVKDNTNSTRPYCYRVLNEEDEYEPWTGTFKTKQSALKWHEFYGVFHEERGHVLALFHRGMKVKL